MFGKKISDKKHEHVLTVWNKFEIKTMKDYLKCDVFFLADIFENFRNNSLKNYGLCPSHYLKTPTLSWDVIANMTKLSSNLFQILIYLCSLKKI